jgi:hypothetical protein
MQWHASFQRRFGQEKVGPRCYARHHTVGSKKIEELAHAGGNRRLAVRRKAGSGPSRFINAVTGVHDDHASKA